MIIKTPTHYFLVFGASEGFTPLNAFDGALLSGGIGDTNLVKMSSIVPPHCRLISPVPLPPGSLVRTAYASLTSDVPGEFIASAVAVAVPEDPVHAGLIMEYSARGRREEIDAFVRNMAVEGMKFRNRKIRDLQNAAGNTQWIKTFNWPSVDVASKYSANTGWRISCSRLYQFIRYR